MAHSRRRYLLPGLLVLLALTMLAATAIGAVSVPLRDTLRIILAHCGWKTAGTFTKAQDSIIFFVRLPRVVAAALVGMALAVSGAAMQGMFRNPMADPGILGVSSGAGLGAVLAVTFGLTSQSLYYLPIFSATGALFAAVIIFLLSSRGGRIPVLTLILSGIAVSTFIGAITSLMLTKMMSDHQINQYLFWSIGSLSARRWEHINLVLLPIGIGVVLLLSFARELNVLMLGEEEAQSVGLSPFRTRTALLVLASVVTAMAVCISGHISFVGLIVPHIMRIIIGPDHRLLLPVSVVAGAIFLVGCDLVARIVVAPAEIGVGIITSLLGAPYFLYLLNRARKEGTEV